MVDVSRMPANAFGYVPTPAIVAPIEFTLRLSNYAKLGGYVNEVRSLASISSPGNEHRDAHPENPWPLASTDAASGRKNK